MINPFKRIRDPNLRTAAQMASVVVVMGSLSFAAVPFYSWFCAVTGFGGAVRQADAAPDHILDRTMRVRFDASIDPNLPWTFRPVEREMTVRIGETALAFYEATNLTDRPIGGQAVYNVTPYAAGRFFDKIDCFCFTEQVLQPGETVLMPVSFYVAPELVDDAEAKFVNTITLSYTFYEMDLPAGDQHAALAEPAAAGALTEAAGAATQTN